MAVDSSVSAASASSPKGVEIDRIDRELASMWASAGDGDAAGGAGVTRACTMNLVVYTTPADDREALDQVLEAVNEAHPGRTLIIVADRSSGASAIEAYVSMRCRVLGGTGKQICGEQVTIAAAGALVDTAASAVEPLLVPDVPMFLWWKDIPHKDDHLFDRLARMADRVVIDSAAFDHPGEDMLRLAAMVGAQAPKLRVSDLNWGRLDVWRMLLSSFWDVPDYRALLAEADRVTINCRRPAGAPAGIDPAALLLAGWLASRLGWDFAGATLRLHGDTAECVVRAGTRTIALAVKQAAAGSAGDDTIAGVVVAAGGVTFTVRLKDGGARLATEARIGATRSVGRVVAHDVRTESERLSGELAFLSRDAVYEAAVGRAAQLLG